MVPPCSVHQASSPGSIWSPTFVCDPQMGVSSVMGYPAIIQFSRLLHNFPKLFNWEMDVSWNGGTPSYPPFLDCIFHEINHHKPSSCWGFPLTMETLRFSQLCWLCAGATAVRRRFPSWVAMYEKLQESKLNQAACNKTQTCTLLYSNKIL